MAQTTIKGFALMGLFRKHSAFKESENLVMKEDGFVQYRIERLKFYGLAHSDGRFYNYSKDLLGKG